MTAASSAAQASGPGPSRDAGGIDDAGDIGDRGTAEPRVQRPAAEVRFADELARLRASDTAERPPGWALSLRAARRFILGDEAEGISRKFVGDPSLIDRALVSLATSRGLMLVGEPGTAKSLLSELLAAAVSGDSTLTIQGGAATTEDQIKYSWNYALLVAEGPSTRSLVPAPLLRGMAEGRVVRFEEITRCPAGSAGLPALAAVRPGARGAGADRPGLAGVRARGLQRDRHGQHARPRRQRDERGPEAALQLRDRLPHPGLRHRAGSWSTPRRRGCWPAPGSARRRRARCWKCW